MALLIPLGVGVAVSVKTPPAMRQGSPVLRVLRGFPITVGLASAFAIIFVSVPIMRVAALVRRQKITDIPLIMSASAYHEVAAKICEVLNRQGLSLQSAEPGWWVSAPMRLLTWLGGEALRSHVPKRFEHFVAHDLALSLYPSGLVLRGRPARLTWAHGLVAEAVVHTEGLQTTDPKAQALEQRLRPLWRSYDLDPARRAKSADLARELDRDHPGAPDPAGRLGRLAGPLPADPAAGSRRARRATAPRRRATATSGATQSRDIDSA